MSLAILFNPHKCEPDSYEANDIEIILCSKGECNDDNYDKSPELYIMIGDFSTVCYGTLCGYTINVVLYLMGLLCLFLFVCLLSKFYKRIRA